MSLLSNSTRPGIVGGLQPPPGITPNFVNPRSIEGTIAALVVVCVVTTTISTLLRMYTRVFIAKNHGMDDYAMCIAWLGIISYCAVGLPAFKYGAGIHQWNVPAEHVVSYAKLANALELIYSPVIIFTKLSILLQFIRIFVSNRKSRTFYLLQTFIWSNLLYFISVFFVSIFQCMPRAKIWHSNRPGHCINYKVNMIVTSVFNLTSDCAMLAMPLFWVWRLKMSARHKLGIFAVFATGTLACTASMIRLFWTVRYNSSNDMTYDLSAVGVCGVGEIAAGMVCGNLPVLPRFFVSLGPKVAKKFSSYFSRLPSASNSHKPSVPWPSPPRAHKPKGNYLELDDDDLSARTVKTSETEMGALKPDPRLNPESGHSGVETEHLERDSGAMGTDSISREDVLRN